MHIHITQIIENQNQKIAAHFDNFQDILSKNLKKMHMGMLHPTVVKIIDKIQEAEIHRIRVKSEEDKKAFQKIFADGLTKIIYTLPSKEI